MKNYRKKYVFLPASFTVEAAFVVPLVILVIVLGIHIAYELQYTNIKEAQKPPAVESLEPVEEKWHED